MPLISSLAAPGSPYRLGRRATRLALHLTPPHPIVYNQQHHLLALATYPPWTRTFSLLSNCPARPWTCGGLPFRRHEDLQTFRRNYSAQRPDDGGPPESALDAYVSSLGVYNDFDAGQSLQEEQELAVQLEEADDFGATEVADAAHEFEAVHGTPGAEATGAAYHRPRSEKQLSRRTRKARRRSRPALVLASIKGSARELYVTGPSGKVDLSYRSPRRSSVGGVERRTSDVVLSSKNPVPLPEPVSLHSVLARYLEHLTTPHGAETEFQYTQLELDLLRSKAYAPDSLEKWASSVLEPRSRIAAKIFEPGRERPPLFLLLLYLRRKHIRVSALGVIMRHIDHRKKIEPISWETLKLTVTRMLRHARQLWPESIPWIASLFATEAALLHGDEDGSRPLSPQMLLDVTHFCNNFLLLLSLPANERPVISSMYLEKAQFHVLQHMASRSPAIVVTRLGFRSVARNQLAHAKTAQEREWAELKGPSWPPWKENRTAMDEDKGYEFGASRASKILHRMYEAGYGGRIWEEMAEIYAGWDTDKSPTIQTRTLLPGFSTHYRDETRLRSLLWAGRIRTTRTRREAWACFLAHDMTGASPDQEIYLAMFEKLFYPTMAKSSHRASPLDSDEEFEQPTADMLPGDMKEVLPDPTSPLHYVFLSEPIPTYHQMYHRMRKTFVRPSNRLLAFLLETCPDFNMALDLLGTFGGGIGHLVASKHYNDSLVHAIPGYLFTAFIRLLCRFGRFDQPPPREPTFLEREQHAYRFKFDRQYLLEYAHALLVRYKPRYRPAWSAYMDKLVQHKGSERAGNSVRYSIICELIEDMDHIDLDIDDELFRLACTATLYAVQTADQKSRSIEEARNILSTGSSRLRTLFHSLVGANADMQSPNPTNNTNPPVPPHVPGPAELHAYVRALGSLHDYEGLYSFSTWLTKHHVEVTARAQATHSGSKLLFRTLVALRAAVDAGLQVGSDQDLRGSAEIAPLIRAQIDGVEEWGGWPAQEYVDMYLKGHLKTSMPGVGGR